MVVREFRHLSTTTEATDLTDRLTLIEERIAGLEAAGNATTMVVFSGDLDRILAAFTMAVSAASLGNDVSMFFTFWATPALRRQNPPKTKKSLVEWMFGKMLRGGRRSLALSQLDMMGMGRAMMKREMARKGVPTLEEQIALAGELGVRICVCETTMTLMGMTEAELIDYPDLSLCGAAVMNEMASRSNSTFFV